MCISKFFITIIFFIFGTLTKKLTMDLGLTIDVIKFLLIAIGGGIGYIIKWKFDIDKIIAKMEADHALVTLEHNMKIKENTGYIEHLVKAGETLKGQMADTLLVIGEIKNNMKSIMDTQQLIIKKLDDTEDRMTKLYITQKISHKADNDVNI
jgi:hypothetical protein